MRFHLPGARRCHQTLRWLGGCRNSQLLRTNSWRGFGGVGSVQSHAGEQRAANDVSERDGKEVPKKNLLHGDGRAEHHS